MQDNLIESFKIREGNKRMRRINIGGFKITPKMKKNINKILNSGRITEYKNVRLFEKNWARYIGTKESIAVNSGTSALIAGLEALKVKYPEIIGTEVITTPLTYIATINALVITGFNPIFIDIDPIIFGILPEQIEENINHKTSMILPVHLMGYPCDMNEINQISVENDLLVLEDACQAHGSIYNGKKVGSLSDLSVFSFYIAHNIQCGQLGAVNTDDKDLEGIIRSIKSNGRMCSCSICHRTEGKCPFKESDFDPRFTHNFIGYNFKTQEIEASIGLEQLKEVEDIRLKRLENVKLLNELLQGFSDILQLPKYLWYVSYLGYPIIVKKGNVVKIRHELEKRGVETRPLFGCTIDQPSFSYLKEQYHNQLKNAKFIGRNGFYIGCHQYLENEDLEYIYKQFKEILR